MKVTIENQIIKIEEDGKERECEIGSKEGFKILSDLWLRSGWDAKYVYTFSWLGRPIIQLPEDILRLQEVIYRLRPEIVIETGIAHGGSLVFHASICNSIGVGRVIGIDKEIRAHNRKAIEDHELSHLITLIEGSSTNISVINRVMEQSYGKKCLVILDSCHTKEHVLNELEAYSPLVQKGFYIVACDGIMKDLVGAPRSGTDWRTNNPYEAAKAFLEKHEEFVIEVPPWAFDESNGLSENITYWPGAWLLRR